MSVCVLKRCAACMAYITHYTQNKVVLLHSSGCAEEQSYIALLFIILVPFLLLWFIYWLKNPLRPIGRAAPATSCWSVINYPWACSIGWTEYAAKYTYQDRVFVALLMF